MTPLRQRYLQDLQLRNYSRKTQEVYVECVSLFARYFGKSPELLGPEDIRTYQLYLAHEKKASWSRFNQTVCALRFLYRHTLHKDWILRRFFLHVLPSRFVRIRHFGFLANCQVQHQIARCRQSLNVDPASLLLPTPPSDWQTLFHQLTGQLVDRCPLCHKGRLVRVEQLNSVPPPLSRSPPALKAAPPPSSLESRTSL